MVIGHKQLNMAWLIALLIAGCSHSNGTLGTDHPALLKGATVKVLAVDIESGKAADSSGFFVSKGGLVVTCKHALGTVPLRVDLADGTKRKIIKVVATEEAGDASDDGAVVDEDTALAVIRVEGRDQSFLPLFDSMPAAGTKLWARNGKRASHRQCKLLPLPDLRANAC